jgi:hypothetical protein
MKSRDEDGMPIVEDFATVSTEQLGGHPAVDLKLVTHSFQILIVNSKGSVFQITNDRGHYKLYDLNIILDMHAF